jgi:hypothetical protein
METLENYPLWIVLLSGLVSLGVYAAGALIVLEFGAAYAAVYLLYCLLLEMRLLKRSCTKCFYYGRICAIFFKKGDGNRFLSDNISFRDLIPDFLVSLIPLLLGVFLLSRDFSFRMLLSVLVLAAFAFPLTGIVRSKLACVRCRQRQLGCPAEKLFSRKKQ